MVERDFTRLTPDEKINGIKASKLPDDIRSKYHGGDVREAIAQLAEMTIQFGVNMGLSPDDALNWARKLQEFDARSQEFDARINGIVSGLTGEEEFYTPIGLEQYMTTQGQEWSI